jgi:predicted regulator of Ras-like GTPase activity (Roadblock/LC7/MglB family)
MPVGAASWSFTEDDFGAITKSLERTGQLVATVGEQPKFDPTAFATLTAADFSANDQLAKLIGENDFNSLFHQGEKESMYLADVARRVILVVLFDNRTTLGLVRLKMKATVDELSKFFEEVFKRGANDASKPNILAGADDEIDKLFQ